MTSATSHDGELVSAYAREGSETAFHALVARHVDLVFATAMRQTGDRGLAEEITQNVFVALARKAPRLAGFETLAGWLHHAAVRESKTRIRSELRRRRREDTAASVSALHREGTAPLESLVPLLDEGLLGLREADRLALILRFIEDRSLREVGDLLGRAASGRELQHLDPVRDDVHEHRGHPDLGKSHPAASVAVLFRLGRRHRGQRAASAVTGVL